MPPIVGPVQRGVPEPSGGFVVSGVGGNCWAGFGLGVDGRKMCQVLIAGDKSLVIDGKEFPIARQEFPLTDDVKAAAASEGGRYGVTMQIKQESLEVTVRAGPSAEMKEMKVAVPVSEPARELLLSKNMTLVCRNGRPDFIPFIDDARKMEPDLMVPAPANRWRFPAEAELYGLYRAAWRLQGDAPGSLTQLREAMLATVDQEPEIQNTALGLYKKNIHQVTQDILGVSDPALATAAVAELAQE
jgi:hypothetical protein